MTQNEPAVKKRSVARAFERFAYGITRFAGSTSAFLTALVLIVLWLVLGPVFHYSSTWQLAVNTGTTIVTFLMVFLIQRSQNKESLAVQLKLNEVVAALQGASNRLVNVEDLDEDDLQTLHKHYRSLAEMAKREGDIRQSHSLDEADERHRSKVREHKTATQVK